MRSLLSHPSSPLTVFFPPIAFLLLLPPLCAGYLPEVLTKVTPRLTFSEALATVQANYKGENNFDLHELIGIQSVSASAQHASGLQAAAQWLVGRMGHMQIQNLRTYEPDEMHPIVYGDWLLAGADKPTILIYGYYDVPPLNPLLSYDEPYRLGISEGHYWGRGVAGGKGAALLALQAVELIFRTEEFISQPRVPKLPFNLKILLESQGEMGSPGLKTFAEQHRDMLEADICLSSVAASLQETPAAPAADSPGNREALEAWKGVFGKEPSFNRDPAALPALSDIHSALGVPITVFGWGLGEGLHSAQERLKVSAAGKAREAWVKLLLRLAQPPAAEELRAASALRQQQREGEGQLPGPAPVGGVEAAQAGGAAEGRVGKSGVVRDEL